MATRRRTALLLAVLAALAGCSGIPGGTPSGTPATESTPATGGTPVEGTGTPAAYPPGAGADGIEDPAALVAAHRAVVAGTDYEATLRRTLYRRQGGAAAGENFTFAVRSDRDARRVVVVADGSVARGGDWERQPFESFANDTVNAFRVGEAGNVTYRLRGATRPFDAEHATLGFGVLNRTLSVGEYAPAGTERRGDRTLVRYDLASVNRSRLGENVSVRSADGTVLVDARGLVHRASVRIRFASTGNLTGAWNLSYAVTPGEVSVERPGWLATAVNRSG